MTVLADVYDTGISRRELVRGFAGLDIHAEMPTPLMTEDF
jgi:hypothetical protein